MSLSKQRASSASRAPSKMPSHLEDVRINYEDALSGNGGSFVSSSKQISSSDFQVPDKIKTPRPLAIVRDYDGLHALLRARSGELGLTREQMDERVGLTAGHSSKLLARVPSKRLGAATFGPVLAAFGIALIAVEDNEALALIEQQLSASDRASDEKPNRYDWRRMKGTGWARQMNGLRTLKLTPEQRRASASRAARARWKSRRLGPHMGPSKQ
jgi:hypothetical protein